MLALVRSRLTYANVVATLALFVALGGTSYAVSQVTGRQIKNRSITRVDVKRDALTGAEIDESRLRTVPRAQNALTAANATSADISKTAGSAGTAAVADVANDAQRLAGQGVGAFEKSSRIAFGRASSVDPAGASGEQVVLSWPEMGVELTSATSQASCPGDTRVAVRNTKPSGAAEAQAFEPGFGSLGTVAAGAKAYFCSHTGSNEDISGAITDSTGRALFFDCIVGNGELRCLGVRSEP